MSSHLLFISGSEIIIIFLAILLLFGADRIPEIARGFAKGLQEFRRVTGEIKREFDESAQDVKKDVDQITREVKDSAQDMTGEFRSYIDDADISREIKDVSDDLKG